MNPDDVKKLDEFFQSAADPEVKAAAKVALLAVLGEPAAAAQRAAAEEERKQAEEQRKQAEAEREATRFNIGLGTLVVGGTLALGLAAAGAIPAAAALGAVATILGGTRVLGTVLGKDKKD